MSRSLKLICLSFFVVLINPLGWHMFLHVSPLYLPFLLRNSRKINFLRPSPVKWMLFFFIYTVFSAIFISCGNGTFDKLIRYFFELLAISIIMNVRKSEENVRLVVKFYIISCIIVALKMLVQQSVLPDDPSRYTIFNFIKHMDPNFLSGLFVLPSVVIFYKAVTENRFKYLLVYSILLLSVFATGSRGGLIAILLGSLIIILKHSNFYAKVAVISLSLVVFAIISYTAADLMTRFSPEGLNDGSNALRFHLWGVAWDIFASNPLWGRGANSMINLGISFGARINIMVHNTYLEILADYGVWGLFLWISVFFNILRKAFLIKNILVISIMVATFFCAFFISAQDSAFWWQNLIICEAMLYFDPDNIVSFNLKPSLKQRVQYV